MEPFKAELARVNAERRRLQKQAYDRDTRLRARRDRALRVGLIAFCHDPAAGSSIATAIMRKYRDWVALNVTDCAAELESRFRDRPVETLAQWLDWEGVAPLQEMLEAKRLVEEVGCSPGCRPRTTPKVHPLHPSSFGRSHAPCP